MRLVGLLAAGLSAACGGGGTDQALDAMPSQDDGSMVDYGGEVLVLGSARDLVVDTDQVTWCKYLAGEVAQVSLSGGDESVLHELEGPTRLAHTATHLFVLGSGNDAPLVALGPGDPVTLTTTADGCCLASDGSSVYWSDEAGSGRTLMRAGADLVATNVQEDFGLSNFTSASDDLLVRYFVDDIETYRPSDGTVTLLHTFVGHRVQAAALNGDQIVAVTVADDGSGILSVWSLELTPGQPTLLGSTASVTSTHSLAFDADYVYFIRYDTLAYGGISRVARTGGDVIELSANQPAPAAVAVVGGYVYWTNGGTSGSADDLNRRGRLMRAPLPD